MLDWVFSKQTIARLTALTAISALATFSLSPATGAKEPKPTVAAFTATGSANEEETASPLVLYNRGGQIILTADVSNATSCVFSSSRALAGMPVTSPCANGVTAARVTLPANAGKRDVAYKFHLKVLGRGAAWATSQTVTVSSQPIPPYPPDCIETGSTWDVSIPSLPALSFQETFDPGFTFTSTSNLVAFGGGSYTVVDGVLTETFEEGGVLTSTWNPDVSAYFGLIDLPDLGETGFWVEPTGSLPAGC